ncbi:MAG: cupin domain-containing protein [Chloroflexi bacterium]|nr:cupin domain-containing protein [Chloroflexota bacterium]
MHRGSDDVDWPGDELQLKTGFDFLELPDEYDALAPDGSEIRLLAETPRASMVHCSLAPGRVSIAVAHRTVEELWYCLEGGGQLWRRQGDRETVVELAPGVSVSIPLGARFQFRNTGDAALRFIIATIPAWPGDDEAFPVPGPWSASL